MAPKVVLLDLGQGYWGGGHRLINVVLFLRNNLVVLQEWAGAPSCMKKKPPAPYTGSSFSHIPD